MENCNARWERWQPFPQIGFFDAGICGDLRRRTFYYSGAAFENIGAMGMLEGRVGVLFDEENGRAFHVDRVDGFNDGMTQERRKPERWLFAAIAISDAPSERSRWPASAALRRGERSAELFAALLQAGKQQIHAFRPFRVLRLVRVKVRHHR